MRLMLILFAALTACGPTDKTGLPSHETKQQLSVTEPGLHVSGYANIGVKRRF